MIGWAAATGGVSLESFVLFLIIFVWTPPHFWALALLRTRDYAKAGVPMLPVVAGPDATRRQILIYSLILAPLGMLPAIIGLGGMLYTVAASVLGSLFVVMAFDCYREREGEAADRAAKNLFAYSVLYLFLLFAVLLVEQGFGIDGGASAALSGRRDARCGKRAPTPPTHAILWPSPGSLAALVVLFFIVTIVRLGGHVADRPL